MFELRIFVLPTTTLFMCSCESVYVSPDRSLELEQRIKQRELIKDLRSRSIADPDNKYFIKGGTICTISKNKS